mmetsp:Transcript_17471/g.39470  ORF Transcript_17471/g.39470 Transcript_17471/m.39470 type:complete len:781 (+) Transcript_17471:214-2556(+)
MAGPGFVDFVVVVGLSLLLCYMLRVLKRISAEHKAKMKARIKAAMEKRKEVKDPFRNTYGYSWDYVMVFKVASAKSKVTDRQKESSMKFILGRMADAGLQNKLFYSVQKDEVYCKIRCALPRLQAEADRINYKLALEPAGLCNKLREGNLKGPKEKQWAGVEIPNKNIETTIDPYDYIYADYRTGEDSLYKKWENDTVFRGVDRLKLIASIISSRLGDGGAFLDVYRLTKNNCMITFFPLHDAVELRSLEDKWLRMCQPPWLQHTDPVKDYFGEKIGLYFKWLGLYCTWLFVAALLGFGFWFSVATNDNNPSTSSVPYFAGIMALWSVFFLEHWKRTENNTSMKWGMTGFEKQEQVRVQFQGETILSPVDGKPELYFPTGVRKRRQYWSSAVINSMCLIVVGVVACIFALRIAIRTTNAELGGVQLASVVASVLLALQVQILNGYFGNVALELNQAENHRTDTEFEDSLISKTFSFQFVNSYAALFYIAFLKPFLPSIDPCLNSNCLEELQTTLGTIFLMRVTIGNITELGLPMLTAYYNNRQLKRAEARRMEAAGVTDLQNVPAFAEDGLNLGDIVGKSALGSLEQKSELSEVESAFLMPHYDVMLGTFDDFAEMVIQFGYTTMFVAAFPLATVLSFVNNYVEIRVDAWKLCQLMRRAEPRSAEDIGTWQSILEFISTAAIIVNSGLVAFTATNMEDSTWTLRSWTFLLMTAGLMAMRTIVAMLIPDEPEWVGIQLKRQEYINGKVLDNIEDEDDSALLNKTGYQVPNFLIDGTDVDPM